MTPFPSTPLAQRISLVFSLGEYRPIPSLPPIKITQLRTPGTTPIAPTLNNLFHQHIGSPEIPKDNVLFMQDGYGLSHIFDNARWEVLSIESVMRILCIRVVSHNDHLHAPTQLSIIVEFASEALVGE